MIFRKMWISETAYKIRQYRNDGRERYVDEDHGGYLRWLAAGNVPEEVPYVPPVVPADDDPIMVKGAKQRKVQAIREKFLELIEETYDPAEIAIRNMQAIDAHLQGKATPAKFTNMLANLDPYITWRHSKIQAIRNCTLVSQVNAILISYP